ncbi:MAG: cytochrome c biogenesis CcdA family protein [Halobacteriota archaeon]
MSTELVGTIAFAVGAGLATFFSPCAYALLPGYLGWYLGSVGTETRSLARDVLRGLSAAVGVGGVFLALIGLVSAIGEAVEPWLGTLELLTGVALIGFGLLLLAGVSSGWHLPLPAHRGGLAGFAAFGAVYAIAAAGCVAPLFLAVVIQALSMGPIETALTLGSYGATVAGMVLATTILISVGYEFSTGRLTRVSVYATRIGGAILVVAGFGQLYLVTG